MRIRMRTTAAGPTFRCHAGDTVTVEDDYGRSLIDAGYAEEVAGPDGISSPVEVAAVDDGEKAVQTNPAGKSTFDKLKARGGNPAPKAASKAAVKT